MKTAILQCFQQSSSTNRKNVYYDQIFKKVKITVPVQNYAKRSF